LERHPETAQRVNRQEYSVALLCFHGALAGLVQFTGIKGIFWFDRQIAVLGASFALSLASIPFKSSRRLESAVM
jgi:hypothetical protein